MECSSVGKIAYILQTFLTSKPDKNESLDQQYKSLSVIAIEQIRLYPQLLPEDQRIPTKNFEPLDYTSRKSVNYNNHVFKAILVKSCPIL
jgi:hypothetical protein